MKVIFILFTLLFFNHNIFSQNDYIVKTKRQATPDINKELSDEEKFIQQNFEYIHMTNWKTGMEFMVEPPMVNPYFSYTPITDNNHIFPRLDRDKYKNKIFTIDHVETKRINRTGIGEISEKVIYFKCEGQIFEYSEYHNYNSEYPYISDLIYLGDVLKARTLLIGKRVYLLADSWHEDGLKWIGAIITNVGASDSYSEPIKVIFKYLNEEYYVNVNLSGTNTSNYADSDKQPTGNFHEKFTFTNPKNKYPKISPSIWTLITKGEVRIGMTKEECKLSWGEPEDINITAGSFGRIEQWVFYGGNSFLYFKNGRLSTIQN